MENALLSKLQEAQAQAAQTRRLLASSKERVALLQTDNSQLESAVLVLKKQLDEANRWVLYYIQYTLVYYTVGYCLTRE